jgi:hypothetical protein
MKFISKNIITKFDSIYFYYFIIPNYYEVKDFQYMINTNLIKHSDRLNIFHSIFNKFIL